jgi:hypothetical protein
MPNYLTNEIGNDSFSAAQVLYYRTEKWSQTMIGKYVKDQILAKHLFGTTKENHETPGVRWGTASMQNDESLNF